ncbi:MAG TPA: ATP-binding protein [Candidatus Saccharimonadales bacterium]|nr:ATP-binding protein [Candidatus Saccharimonadales bacterium]
MKSPLWPYRFRVAAMLTLLLLMVSGGPTEASEQTIQKPEIEPEDANAIYSNPTNGLGSWIWEAQTHDDQTCFLWRTFDIPPTAKVTKARLAMTVDNEFTLYLDGRELGRGAEWRELFIFDLTPLLTPGHHVLAVNCYNGSFFAGMLFGLRIDLADGQSLQIQSDTSWRVVPDGVNGWETRTVAQPNWPAATVIAPLGGNPWWTTPDAVDVMPSLQPIKVFFWQTRWFQITLLCICGLVIGISLRLMAQLALHRREQRLLENERTRIAMDIHDDIGARMTQLVVQGEVIQNTTPVSSELRKQIGWICEESRSLLSSMDEILWAVNPQRDTLRDFADYVCKYAQDFLKSTNIRCLFEVSPGIPGANFSLAFRRSLFMAIKEALNNAAKHSKATTISLKILLLGQWLQVVVQDNGIGFAVETMKTERNGLTNMARRMEELGGRCVITSRPNNGCQIEFSVPLTNKRRNFWVWR